MRISPSGLKASSPVLSTSMQYREIKPKLPLSQFVECLWTLEGDGRSQVEGDLILPDGCVEMVLDFGDPFCEHKQDNQKLAQPMRLVGSRQEAVGTLWSEEIK